MWWVSNVSRHEESTAEGDSSTGAGTLQGQRDYVRKVGGDEMVLGLFRDVLFNFVFQYIFSPISAAWEGGQLYQEQADILSQFITRDQYEESGNDYLFERSDIW